MPAAATSAATGRPPPNPGFEHIQRSWDATQGRWSAKILPGEYYVTGQDEAITTILGSCISACIRDRELRIGGMNHFMLPEDTSDGQSSWMDKATGLATRYGSFAMESLVNEILKRGGRRQRLEVKLFGGGKMLASMIDVGARNIAFARQWLRTEGFILVAEDVGDTVPRRIVYTPADGRVRVRHLMSMESRAIATREQNYLSTFRQKPDGDDIELFD
ncbi:MAG: putative chemoreceptor glutamine deamidase CheD 1 [Pseudomonadota bacterium]|jgi:chemotaxis protein CheD